MVTHENHVNTGAYDFQFLALDDGRKIVSISGEGWEAISATNDNWDDSLAEATIKAKEYDSLSSILSAVLSYELAVNVDYYVEKLSNRKEGEHKEMLIIRTQTEDGVRTFTFSNESELRRAIAALQVTTCKGFAARVSSPDDKHGIILDRWDYSTRYSCSLHHTIQRGAYRDLIYEVFGTKDECVSAVNETIAVAVSWASRSASLKYIAGDLFAVEYKEPYTD